MEKNVSRREFFRIAGVAGAAIGLAGGLGGIVAACGEEGTTTTAPTGTTAAPATTAPSANGPPAEAVTVKLPDPVLDGPVSVESALKARRSIRDYTGEPLTVEEVARLMWATQGITAAQRARTAPSAGGTYPLELLVVAGQITGLQPGVYRYRPHEHDLVLVLQGDLRADLAQASLDQVWVANAPLDVVMAGVYERTTERYGDRGVRYVYMEAGHAAENLLLQAVALGLGAVVVGAFYDDQVRDIVGLAVDERPLYVIPVGRPAV